VTEVGSSAKILLLVRRVLPMRRKGHQIFRQTGLCLECGGILHVDEIEYNLEWQRNHYHFRGVPAFVCVECGDVWLKIETLFRLAKLLATQRRKASSWVEGKTNGRESKVSLVSPS
jgi:YgiT-type zinc finger domain-containing protein